MFIRSGLWVHNAFGISDTIPDGGDGNGRGHLHIVQCTTLQAMFG